MQEKDSLEHPMLQVRLSIETDYADDPHIYESYYEYLLSLIGFAVGFGSFWRFPYLVYKNGGGVFLIPYLIALFVVGIPLLYLETAVGQMHRRSVPMIYARINKGFKMIGFTFLLVCYHFASYYNIILTYSYRFIFSAFHWQLPFANESPIQNHYFSQIILNKSSSINDFGGINWQLFILYIISLIVCYQVIKKGVKTSGKIITFTALMPYFFFLILLIRALFLPGAGNGIIYLFTPKWYKLFHFEIWIDAIVQVFYQMTVACSGIINLSSMKPRRQKFIIGVYAIPASILICGLMCSLNIFMYLGHFCDKLGLQIDDLQLSGPQLSFNIFPKALAILPWPNIWILCFFIAMVFLGIDSQFGYLESIFCYLKDEYKQGGISIYGYEITLNHAKKYILASIMIFSPTLSSYAGIYYLQFYDSFVATIPLSLGALIQFQTFVYIFPFSQLEKQTFKYTGQSTPKWISFLIQGKILFIILIGNFIFACINQFFFFFQYSIGFYLFGWILTSYPYIIAYWYYKKYKQDKSKLTFAQLNHRQSYL